MQNKRPVFTDKELGLIEEILGNYKLEGKRIRQIFLDNNINEVFWKCKFYRIGFRVCKECGCHRECEDLNEQLICKKCQPKVQSKCNHCCFHQEGNNEEGYNWHCSDCGKIDNDLGGMY